MLSKIIDLKNADNSIKELCESIRQGIPSAVFGITDAFKNFLVSTVENKVLYVARDYSSANSAFALIKQFSNKKVVLVPPKDELLLMTKAFSKDSVYKRITASHEIRSADVIIATAETLMQIFPISVSEIKVEKNQDIIMHHFISLLVQMGYRRVETVDNKGLFSVRGDIVEIFPINAENPVRIDFFGDTVESIKTVDVESKRRIEFVDSIGILQAEEITFKNDNLTDIIYNLKKQVAKAPASARARLYTIISDLEVALENRDYDTLSYLAPLSHESGNILDMLGSDAVVIFDEAKRIHEFATLAQTEFTERFNSLLNEGEVFEFAKNNFLTVEELKIRINKFRTVALQSISAVIPFFNPLKIINPTASGVANYQLDFKEVFTDISNWLYAGYSVLVCTGEQKRAENFSLELSDRGIASAIGEQERLQGVCITTEKLNDGFVFHEQKVAVIGSGNLFVKPPLARKATLKKKQNFFTAPEAGDFCVHEVHGVGRVLGSKRISSTEGTKDYIAVEYHGGDMLYIPVEQMDILTRYLGGEKKPKLSKIGGKDFERIKKSVRESIKKMSIDLKKLYSERQNERGHRFEGDSELQQAFINDFPFEDTPDQIVTDGEITEDMLSDRVMDRLVCGDVGFGKTEIAFRAIFRAIAEGKQAVMLAPTTILTEQHYNTAVERFKNFGFKIACLNRFKTPLQQKKIVEGLKDGSIDFVIGTHRLLSKDIAFKDLGILVLDEEQRFGVEHKEKIKLLKKNIDAITLTATPIPRTLHMALSGIRSISTINTPPKKRLPVQTYVTEETDSLIRDAVSREVNRGGQVFILYNHVDSIFTFAERVKSLLPNLRVTVAHGQMEERSLENNIMQFYRGETDLLISTTIIENGIDLPKANTLIVIDADMLGLSTLYQLKGRVGRSDRLAYAYFTYKRDKILSQNAFDRLNAIIEFAEMGSGIKIAMRDLEIRGAGNILGAEQHGHMEKIGYELYSKLLKEELSETVELIPELDIRVTAYIPEKYIERNNAKMEAYKEIAEIKSVSAEEEVRSALEETYGELPLETENLINIAIVKCLAGRVGVNKITVSKHETSVVFEDFKAFSNKKLTSALDEFEDRVTVKMSTLPTLEFLRQDETNEDMLELMKRFFYLTA